MGTIMAVLANIVFNHLGRRSVARPLALGTNGAEAPHAH